MFLERAPRSEAGAAIRKAAAGIYRLCDIHPGARAPRLRAGVVAALATPRPGWIARAAPAHTLYSRITLTALIAGPLGFAYGVVIVVARAILYDRVPVEMQGRVFAFQGVLGSLASILPLILVGLVSYWLGPRVVLLLVAAVNVAVAWYALRLVPPQTSAASHTIASSPAAGGEPVSSAET